MFEVTSEPDKKVDKTLKEPLEVLINEIKESRVTYQDYLTLTQGMRLGLIKKDRENRFETNYYLQLLQQVFREQSYETVIQEFLKTFYHKDHTRYFIYRLKNDDAFFQSFLQDKHHGPLFIQNALDNNIIDVTDNLSQYAINNLTEEEQNTVYNKNKKAVSEKIKLTLDDIKDELDETQSIKNDGNASFHDDLVKIGLFLSDWKRAKRHFNKIENFLKQPQNNNTKAFSNYIYNLLKNSGFSGVAKVNDALSEQEFLALFENKLMIKDVAFRDNEHGEWGHFLQWFCIIEEFKASGFLQNNPVDIYEFFGQGENYLYWDPIFEGSKQKGIAQSKNNPSTFTFIYEFNQYLLNNDEFPSLAKILHEHIVKKKPDIAANKPSVPSYCRFFKSGLSESAGSQTKLKTEELLSDFQPLKRSK